MQTPSPEEGESEAEDTPGNELFQYLLQQHRHGALNAKQVCIIAYWAAKAGVSELQPIALPPDTVSSGDFKRLLDKFLHSDGPDTYILQAPAFVRSLNGKGMYDFHCVMPHEGLLRELEGEDLAELAAVWDPPPNYSRHPVVQAANASPQPTHVVPLSLFLDGVSYAKRDSVLVISVHNLWTGRRILCCAVRKRLLCHCSCRGWDTLCKVFAWLRWCIQILADGRHPACRHDGSAWDEDIDGMRAELAGEPLPFKGAVCQVRADWAEIAHTLQVPQWASGTHPCFLCKASKRTLYSLLPECSSTYFPWALKTYEDYDQACRRCENRVVLTEDSWTTLCELLQPDHRTHGVRGYALTADVPELALRKRDRLDPSASVHWDVDELWGEEQPESVILWRRSQEGMGLRRNPLLAPELGLTLDVVVAIDVLHTLCLGVFMQFVHGALWMAVEHLPTAEAAAAATRADRMEHNMQHMRVHYKEWLKHMRITRPGVLLTAVGDMTMELLGKKGVPKLKSKGHEIINLLRWVNAMLLPIYHRLPQGQEWSQAAGNLESLWDVLAKAPMVVPPAAREDLLALTCEPKTPPPPMQGKKGPNHEGCSKGF